MSLQERRQLEFDKYARVYRDYPRYGNRQVRVDLVREWIESLPLEIWETDPTTRNHWLLDVGCGRGEVIEMAHRELVVDAMGCDVVKDLCDDLSGPDEALRGIDHIAGAHQLPYDDAEFGYVTCTDVLEHCLEEDIPAILRELKRVARGPVLLCVCHIEDRPGKYGPDTLHVTVKPWPWWEQQIIDNMGVEPHVLWKDKLNSNGTWCEVDCT